MLAFAGSLATAKCSDGSDWQRHATVTPADPVVGPEVQVVEIPASEWYRESIWRLSERASLVIGEIDGPLAYEFNGIRGLVRLDDGTIVVADYGSRQIRFFTSTGTHIRSVGHEGDGPGEYRNLASIAKLAPDSIVVWDSESRRATVLDATGELARMLSLAQVGGNVFDLDVMADRSLVGRMNLPTGMTQMRRPGVLRSETSWVRLVDDGEVETIGRFFAGESWVTSTPPEAPSP